MDLDRRTLVGGAAVILAVAVLLTLAIGFRPLTPIDELAAGSGYSGLVAYSDAASMSDQCVRVIDLATAEPVMPAYCAEYVHIFAFGSEGVVVDGTDGPLLLPLDGRQPVPTSLEDFEFLDPEGPPPRREEHERSPRVVVDGATILELNGPSDYVVEQVTVSPTGDLVLAIDSAERLIVLRADGSGAPALIDRDVQMALWQGRDPG